jgi:4a-hydroxytetrahydrobiopterin dehydratase
MIGNRKNELKGLAMTEELTQKVCTPYQAGIPPLTHEEAAQHLGLVQGWELLDDARRIERTDRFKNFWEALAFVQGFGELAEAEGAPPERLFRLGLRHGLSADQEDQGAARERLHHGGEDQPLGRRRRPRRRSRTATEAQSLTPGSVAPRPSFC